MLARFCNKFIGELLGESFGVGDGHLPGEYAHGVRVSAEAAADRRAGGVLVVIEDKDGAWDKAVGEGEAVELLSESFDDGHLPGEYAHVVRGRAEAAADRSVSVVLVVIGVEEGAWDRVI